MARHALSPTCLALVRQVEAVLAPVVSARPGRSLRVGLSGGADSLALTASLAWACQHRAGPLAGVDLTARVVDHGLQAGSAEVAQRAAAQAEALGVRADVIRVTVTERGDGVEAAARVARYRALRCPPEAVIVLGHTMDDQAETVLLGLARGSGIWSLAGMPTVQGDLVRPFLASRRTDTEQACRDWGLDWWEDPTNASTMFTRSRLRAAMGELDRILGPGLASSLARTATLAREGADFIDAAVDQTGILACQNSINLESLPESPAVRHRVLLLWLRCHGGDAVTYTHVIAVDSLINGWHGQKGIAVPGGSITRSRNMLTFVEQR